MHPGYYRSRLRHIVELKPRSHRARQTDVNDSERSHRPRRVEIKFVWFLGVSRLVDARQVICIHKLNVSRWSCFDARATRRNAIRRNALCVNGTLKPRLHRDICCRTQVVSTCCRQHVSCIGNKIVASLSPVCCWIQKDTSRPWHKWIVIMSLRYSQHVSRTSNLYPTTCFCRHICFRIHVARPGHMFPGDMCPGVNAA